MWHSDSVRELLLCFKYQLLPSKVSKHTVVVLTNSTTAIFPSMTKKTRQMEETTLFFNIILPWFDEFFSNHMQIWNSNKIRQKYYCEVSKEGGGIFVVQFKDSLRHSFNHDKPFAWQCVKKKEMIAHNYSRVLWFLCWNHQEPEPFEESRLWIGKSS